MKNANRKPHAILDRESRFLKAQKIERLLQTATAYETGLQTQLAMLEIGTGSGYIAHYFGSHSNPIYRVVSIDVFDSRRVTDGYEFHAVTSTKLPYSLSTFDVIITNHVIEHVGGVDEQLQHLKEIKRVLKPAGVGYLAVPNRWQFIEPHYKVPMLSWLPERLRTPYLKATRKADNYDCRPLTSRQIERLFLECGLVGQNLCVEALYETLYIERPESFLTRLLTVVPSDLLTALRRVIPTQIYRFGHAQTN